MLIAVYFKGYTVLSFTAMTQLTELFFDRFFFEFYLQKFKKNMLFSFTVICIKRLLALRNSSKTRFIVNFFPVFATLSNVLS